MNLAHLKSGSDIRGTAYGEHLTLTEDIVARIGASFGLFIAKKYGLPIENINIAVGRDSRITGENLSIAFAKGLSQVGAKAILFGMCTTPSMFHCLIHEPEQFTASVMVTASHHPFDKNGLKFFTKEGGLNSTEISTLLSMAEAQNLETPNDKNISYVDYLKSYSKSLSDLIKGELNNATEPLKGLHIVVDSGNGAGGFYESILQSLGANTSGSQFTEPNGFFPNHQPNPENKEAIASLAKAVLEHHADLGVIFDADCDRAAIVDKTGKEINRNRLIALISAILLEKNKGITVVTDSVTSTGLTKFIKQMGGCHHRFKRGYRNVIDEAIRLNAEGKDTPLAIETSGHCALRDNHYLDDGMFLATQLIIQAQKMALQGRNLTDFIKDLEEPVEACELRLNILAQDFKAEGERVIAKVKQVFSAQKEWTMASTNYEGVRFYYNFNGTPKCAWFLLRLSVHDPVMPINIESDEVGAIPEIKKALLNVLQDEPMLSIDVLR